MQYLQNTNF